MKSITRSWVSFFLCVHSNLCLYLFQLNKKGSKDSSAAKKFTAPPAPSPSTNPKPQPPPPPGHQPKSSSSFSSSSSNARSSSQSLHSIPDRRSSVDSLPPAPPIVVVSPDPASDQKRLPQTASNRHSAALDHHTNTAPHANTAPPRTTRGLRPNQPSNDTIPIVGKPPRKQRSSRFVVKERVEIERLAPFMGLLPSLHVLSPPPHRAPQKHPQMNVLNCL